MGTVDNDSGLRRWIRDRVEWPAVGLLLRLGAVVLPRLPYGAVWAMARLGGLMIWLVPRYRRLVRANVALALPEGEPGLARRSLTHVCATFLESIWFRGGPERILARVSLPEDAAAVIAEAAERGWILISPHLGNWELGFLRLTAGGYPMGCVAARQPNPAVERFFHESRAQCGGDVIYEDGAARGILRTLRSGGGVAMLVDQNTVPKYGGIFVDFFGLPVPVSRAPAALARKVQVPVVVAYCRRLGGGRFAIRARRLTPAVESFADERAVLEAVNGLTAALIRESPEQYLWMYRRWRFVPADADDALMARFPYYARRLKRRQVKNG